MVRHVNQIYCGDHFKTYTNIKSYCTSKITNIMCVNTPQLKNHKEKKKKM